MKNPLTSAGIEPATFRFVAQHLNHCATAVPPFKRETNGISQILFGNTCLLESDENRGVYINIFERLDRYMAASLCHIYVL